MSPLRVCLLTLFVLGVVATDPLETSLDKSQETHSTQDINDKKNEITEKLEGIKESCNNGLEDIKKKLKEINLEEMMEKIKVIPLSGCDGMKKICETKFDLMKKKVEMGCGGLIKMADMKCKALKTVTNLSPCMLGKTGGIMDKVGDKMKDGIGGIKEKVEKVKDVIESGKEKLNGNMIEKKCDLIKNVLKKKCGLMQNAVQMKCDLIKTALDMKCKVITSPKKIIDKLIPSVGCKKSSEEVSNV